MSQKQYRPGEIVAKLREADVLLGQEKTELDICLVDSLTGLQESLPSSGM